MSDTLNLDVILANSCYNPVYPEGYDWSKWDGKDKPEWNSYRIETHCLAFDVIAKPNGDGTYTIKSYTTEDC